MSVAYELLQRLLREGWIEIEEERKSGQWITTWLHFVDVSSLRRALGLKDLDAEREAWLIESSVLFSDARLQSARDSLDGMPVSKALTYLRILRKLEVWAEEKRFGTYRDFSQFAAESTKAMKGQWKWLESHVNLEDFCIQGHALVIWLRAPLVLKREQYVSDLRFATTFQAFTIEDLLNVIAVDGTITSWRLIENRTSFERAARKHGATDGVIWLPGFPSDTWKKAVQHLVNLKSVSAYIACDPDPAGIEIALHAAAIWDGLKLPWFPWMMSKSVLEEFPVGHFFDNASRSQSSFCLTSHSGMRIAEKLLVWRPTLSRTGTCTGD